ncbi:MAG: PucR family transcriptional regulator [bacterium]
MKLKNILNMPEFYDLDVLAGHKGLDKEVDTVTVMDAPDIENWMKGREFLISTAYIFKDNPEILEDKIIKLNQKNVSGFGIKLDRFIKELPPKVIRKANELNFPIIYIPNKYPFIDIINPILTKIINEQADKLIKSEKIHNSFTDLAIRDEGTERILETLSEFIRMDCLFIDKVFLKRFYSSKNTSFYNNTSDLKIEVILSKYHNITVNLNQKIFGYLVFEESVSFDDKISYGKIAIDHALTILRLDQRRKITKHQVEEKFRDKFIRDLLFNNIDNADEAIRQARIYNWNFYCNYNVLNLSIDDYDYHLKIDNNFNKLDYLQDEVFTLVNEQFKNIFSEYIYTTMRSSIIYLVDLEGNKNALSKLDKVINKINIRSKEKYDFIFTLGVGEQVDNLYEVNKSFQQSKKAVNLSKKINEKKKIYFYKDLKYYKVLDQIKNKKIVNEFIKENISEIKIYDENNSSDLLLTLKKYIKNNCNIRKTADEMYLHYNTIKKRLKKLEEVTGLDLSDNETLFNLSLAIKLSNIR